MTERPIPKPADGELLPCPSGVERYTKKPVTIEAIQLKTGRAATITDWMGRDSNGNNRHAVWDGHGFTIKTLEGEMRANEGDWIIKGVNGEFYPCKPDIFEKTYTRAALSNGGGEVRLVNGHVIHSHQHTEENEG